MRHLLLFVSLCAAACASRAGRTTGFDDAPPPGPVFGGEDAGTTGFGGETPPSSACSEEAKLVYVVSQEYDLYSFRPDALEFKKIGRLRCPSNGATPNSMAIDRSGTAWVNYSNGALFKVSTKDASCERTSYQGGQGGMVKFGMAFTTNGATSSDETLFVSGIEDGFAAGGGGKGLATIDLATMKLTRVGDYDGTLRGEGAELTGTGDGRLYGFFTTFPDATLATIDKATAATSEARELEGVNTGQAWAFSFWGGDFWFYTSNGIEPSRVTRLRPQDGTLQVVKNDVGGFRIVGAGVSTCAPLTTPR